MAIVINWKTPKDLKDSSQIEAYLHQQGILVQVKQCHRVPSGKMNITVEGSAKAEMDFWRLVKVSERESIRRRATLNGTNNQ